MSEANNQDWNGKVAVVTGAGSGIGAALARHCADLGMHVIGCDVDTKGLAQLEKELSGKGQSLRTLKVDVTDPEAIEQLADSVFAEHGAVNLLFNNAGVLVDGKSWEQSYEDWRWNFDVNVMGVISGIRSFVPRMLKQQQPGTIVNTSSIGGLLAGGSFLAPYQGTKHAVAAITESLYAELALEDAPITAACLCPGDTDTGIWESERLKEEEDRVELGSDEEQQFHDAVAGMCARGMTPDDLAVKTLQAIEAGKFWLFPSPEFKPIFQVRVDTILNESMPPTPEEMMERMAKYMQ